MRVVFAVIALGLLVAFLLLMARMVIELTRSFARTWRPSGVAAIGIELVYSSTDPPVRLLRRLIPPLRLGGISLDVSVLLLLIGILLLRTIALQLALR